jgi:(heptosyl)LPS beta-1,4-glucosyltransferase
MEKLTVVIITKNEELRIRRVLTSVKGLVDEIIIVDDASDDRTVAIARDEFGARVFTRSLNCDYASQRNFGAEQASYDWILAMDADEILSVPAGTAIRKLLGSEHDCSIVVMGRLNHLCGVPLSHGGRDKDHRRLYNRRMVRFHGKVHEHLEGGGVSFRLEVDVWHFPAESVDSIIRKGLDYTEQDARRYVSERPSMSVKEIRYRLTWRPLKVFWKLYVKNGGCRDGLAGLAWSVIHVIGSTVFWLKVWQFARQSDKLNTGG